MGQNVSVQEIVKDWLVEHGYGGLCDPGECGCEVGDLMPCGYPSLLGCVAGYKGDAPAGSEFEGGWCIYAGKPSDKGKATGGEEVG